MTFTKRQAEAVRSVVGLPADDWQPHHWDVFEAARHMLGRELDAWDRAQARKRAFDEQRASVLRRDAVKARKAAAIPPHAREALRERSGWLCEVNDPVACRLSSPHQAQHVHHLAGRAGSDPHRLSNLLHVCLDAHDWIHAHPEQSYARGWLVKRLGVQS